MKTMYISEEMARLLRESVLADAVEPGVMSSLSKTPYLNSSLFMGGGNIAKRFMDKALVSSFEEAKNRLKNFGQIDSVDANTVEDAFRKIVAKCQKIEEPNKDALERLAANYVIKLFSVPDDTVKIETRLVREIEGGDEISPVEPFDGERDFEVDSVNDISGLDAEVSKRDFINLLNMGAGIRFSENIRGYLDDLYDIDSRLPQLYKEALALNDYMIFKSPDLGITDKTRNQIGLVNVNYGPADELVSISAQGVIFPILLCELIRGFMELFSSHGLPKEMPKAKYIIGKSDYLKAEPWQMRLGPYMWDIFMKYFEKFDSEDIPYIYKMLATLKPETFFKVLSEMMAKTRKGKEYSEKIANKSLRDKDLTRFVGRMSLRKQDKSIITDGCMDPEEL